MSRELTGPKVKVAHIVFRVMEGILKAQAIVERLIAVVHVGVPRGAKFTAEYFLGSFGSSAIKTFNWRPRRLPRA